MNEPETRMILAHAAALDNRRVTDATVALWYELFGGYEYAEVKWALVHHARSSTDYLTPAHLIQIINHKREEYRWMNPSAPLHSASWLSFEQDVMRVARDLSVEREKNPGRRYAVEVMDGYTPKEIESGTDA